MFQKEFVDKILAKSGTKAYGRLSINAQDCYNIERLFNVARGSFLPPPKVDSSVIRITKRKRELADGDNVITRLFSQKNKKVRNLLNNVPEELANKRPWQLTVEEIKKLIKLSHQ
jgi:16S rRNA A1518/A1519 N6-dimethyltransferase RsmA/KsgA/DIM1 with predicted DNA glycosylase/AP lyase activity